MAPNAEFVGEVSDALAASGADQDTVVLFLCRSGARSRGAAMAMTRAGYRHAFNIGDGFEGALDAERHRGANNGWKAAGLPWKQS
jgi:rhodanese-related sulfurtransferase